MDRGLGQSKPKTRRVRTGEEMADALMSMFHMMYQKKTARGAIDALIRRLEGRRAEFL